MLLCIASSMAAFTAARRNLFGRDRESSHLDITSIAWLVSILVYIGLGSAVNSQLLVDWDMLDASLEKKPDGYKMWLSKQHTRFCGTRLQASYYKGLKGKQAWCPNCERT